MIFILYKFYPQKLILPITENLHFYIFEFRYFWYCHHTHTHTHTYSIYTHTKKLYICLSSSSHNRQRLSSYYFSWTHEHFPEVSLFPVYRTDSNDEVLQENKLFITYIWIWVFYELIMHKSLFSVPQLLLINYC